MNSTGKCTDNFDNFCEFVKVQEAAKADEAATADEAASTDWPLSSGKYICQWCGKIALETDSRENIPCTGDRSVEITGPSLAVKAFNFAKSYAKHIATGCKECTKEHILARFENCVSCNKYNKFPDPHGSCLVCGCFVNTLLASEGLNKLSWAEQECPHPDGSKWHSVDSKVS